VFENRENPIHQADLCALVTLDALGVSGRKWPEIKAAGGPAAFLARVRSLGTEHRPFRKKRPISDEEIQESLANFLRSGGDVLGVDGLHGGDRLQRTSARLYVYI